MFYSYKDVSSGDLKFRNGVSGTNCINSLLDKCKFLSRLGLRCFSLAFTCTGPLWTLLALTGESFKEGVSGTTGQMSLLLCCFTSCWCVPGRNGVSGMNVRLWINGVSGTLNLFGIALKKLSPRQERRGVFAVMVLYVNVGSFVRVWPVFMSCGLGISWDIGNSSCFFFMVRGKEAPWFDCEHLNDCVHGTSGPLSALWPLARCDDLYPSMK